MILRCRDLVEAETAAREGALSPLELLTYRVHLAWCGRCRTYVRQMDAMLELLKRSSFDELTSDEVHQNVLRRLGQSRSEGDAS